MKILQVNILGTVSKEGKKNVESEIKRGIQEGIIVHDNTLELNILEFDKIEVSNNGKSN